MRIRLRHERLARELARGARSQNGWALTLGLSSGHLSKLVNGRRPYPGAATREKLLQGLGVPFEELFEIETSSARRARTGPGGRFRTIPVASTDRRRARNRGDGIMDVLSDLRYALRMVLRAPGFSVLSIAVLALGVGAASAVFSILNGLLLEPLPFRDPERLVLLQSTLEPDGSGGPFSYPDFLDLRDRSETLEVAGAFGEENFILGGPEGAERVPGELVTPEYLAVLGVEPATGNGLAGLAPDELVVLVSDDLFRRRFGGESSLIGSEIDLNDRRFTVAGVLPPGFHGFTGSAELFVPMSLFDVVNPALREYAILERRGTRWHSVIARLADGVSFEEARAEARALAATLRQAYPRENEARGAGVVFAHDELVSDYRSSVWLLVAAVGFLILITCANLANLFLARVLERRPELAVRTALGASHKRLVRQLLTETAAFGLLGGVLGFVLARWCLSFLVAFAPAELPGYLDVGLDARVFAFTLGLSLATGLVFGLLPAWSARRASLSAAARESMRPGTGRRLRAQSSLALVEIAIATMLLVGTGLVVKSFQRMLRFDPGFATDHLLTMGFHLPEDVLADSPEAAGRFLDAMVDAVSALPGVEAAAVSSHVYFGSGYMSGDLTVEDYTPPAGAELRTYRNFVGPGYFDAMGLGIVRGRAFEPRDRADAPGVLIVNESFAETLWPNEDPIGKRVKLGENPERPWSSVVGVAADVKPSLRLTQDNRLPQVYAPIHQGGLWARSLVVRTRLDPLSLSSSVRVALQRLHPGVATFTVSSMEQLLAKSRATPRGVTYLLGAFATLALIIAAVGLYAVVSYSVRRSTHELGVRLALGARRADVLGMVLRRSLALVAAGLALGLVAAAGTTRLFEALLYEVDPLDSATFGIVTATMLVVVLVASLPPAVRACSVDPAATLRRE